MSTTDWAYFQFQLISSLYFLLSISLGSGKLRLCKPAHTLPFFNCLSLLIFLFQSLKWIASEYYNSWHGIPFTSTLPHNCMCQCIFAASVEFSGFCLRRLVSQDTLCQLSLLRNSSLFSLINCWINSSLYMNF